MDDKQNTNYKIIRCYKRLSSFLPKIFTFLGAVSVSIYFMSWISVLVDLKNLNLFEYANYVDIASLALKAKLNVFTIIIGFVFLSLAFIFLGFLYNEYMQKNESELNRNKQFALTLFLCFTIIGALFWLFNYFEVLLYGYLTLLAIMVGILFICAFCNIDLNKYKFISRISEYITLLVAITCMFAILFFPMYGVMLQLDFWIFDIAYFFMLFVFSCMIRAFVIKKSLSEKIVTMLILIIIFIIPIGYLIQRSTNSLVFTNAALEPKFITLLQVQADNNLLGQKLEMDGFHKVNSSESNSILTAGKDLFGYILSNNESMNYLGDCKSKNNRLVLQEIYNSNNNQDFSVFYKYESCLSYSKIVRCKYDYNQVNWAKKAFVEQNIDGKYYIYWIFGAHIPYFIRNKSIVLAPNMTNEMDTSYQLIKYDSENGLKSFDIVDIHQYKPQADKDNQEHLEFLSNILFNESSMK